MKIYYNFSSDFKIYFNLFFVIIILIYKNNNITITENKLLKKTMNFTEKPKKKSLANH